MLKVCMETDPSNTTTQPHNAAGSHPQTTKRVSRERLGKWCLSAGVMLLTAFAFLPTPYAISSPGPAFNAIGEATINEDGKDVDRQVIDISGATEYRPDAGQLFVMTVSVAGNPQSQPRWIEVMSAWADPARDVKPVELYYPEGVTIEQRDQYTTQMMVQSEDTAIAAALHELGYEVQHQVVVQEVTADSAASGKLQPGDRVISVGDQKVADMDDPTRFDLKPQPTPVVVERDGKEQTVEITPKVTKLDDGSERPLLGIVLQYSMKFPIDVNIELGDVGGPSAGTTFALSVYDLLTPGNLTNGKNVAATGTITPTGDIGPIGGVRQKYHAAVAMGADYFLVPESNCAEAIGTGAPTEIPTYAVKNLDEALNTVEAAGRDEIDGLRSCQQAVDAGIPQA